MTTAIFPDTAVAADPRVLNAPPLKRRPTRRQIWHRIWTTAITALVLFIVVYPLFWLISGAFKTEREFVANPTFALPENWLNFENFSRAITEGNLGRFAFNSAITVFPSLAIILIIGAAAAFALQIMVWRGRSVVMIMFLSGILVPIQMILLPLFTIYFNLNLTGTRWPLVITYTAIGIPLTVFMLATFYRAVPTELFEAAAIDGASIYRIFWSIGMPMVRNAIFTVALVQFFFLWNDLLIALTFVARDDLRTMQVGLLHFRGNFGFIEYGPTFAAIALNIIGTLAVYLFLNKRIMKGLAAGSVKG